MSGVPSGSGQRGLTLCGVLPRPLCQRLAHGDERDGRRQQHQRACDGEARARHRDEQAAQRRAHRDAQVGRREIQPVGEVRRLGRGRGHEVLVHVVAYAHEHAEHGHDHGRTHAQLPHREQHGERGGQRERDGGDGLRRAGGQRAARDQVAHDVGQAVHQEHGTHACRAHARHGSQEVGQVAVEAEHGAVERDHRQKGRPHKRLLEDGDLARVGQALLNRHGRDKEHGHREHESRDQSEERHRGLKGHEARQQAGHWRTHHHAGRDTHEHPGARARRLPRVAHLRGDGERHGNVEWMERRRYHAQSHERLEAGREHRDGVAHSKHAEREQHDRLAVHLREQKRHRGPRDGHDERKAAHEQRRVRDADREALRDLGDDAHDAHLGVQDAEHPDGEDERHEGIAWFLQRANLLGASPDVALAPRRGAVFFPRRLYGRFKFM